MKRIKQLKGWGIFQNNKKEVEDYGFAITVLHPDDMEYPYMCNPGDSDWEFDTVEAAERWIRDYNKPNPERGVVLKIPNIRERIAIKSNYSN